MDAERFDGVARLMGKGLGRRALMRALLGSAGAGALVTFGAGSTLAGKPCASHLDCPKNQLCGTDRRGRQACVAANCTDTTVAVCKNAEFAACCEPGSTVCCHGDRFALCCPDTFTCGPSDVNGYPACVPPA